MWEERSTYSDGDGCCPSQRLYDGKCVYVRVSIVGDSVAINSFSSFPNFITIAAASFETGFKWYVVS